MLCTALTNNPARQRPEATPPASAQEQAVTHPPELSGVAPAHSRPPADAHKHAVEANTTPHASRLHRAIIGGSAVAAFALAFIWVTWIEPQDSILERLTISMILSGGACVLVWYVKAIISQRTAKHRQPPNRQNR
ncbi:hypothetical protein [Pandoraea sp. NPDC087047]|uniref:hypothetical protein n=1 Tax=Pandoraea sp. NPDC087047 TaxID=3364390 RepID=UPI0037FF1DB0